MQYRAVLVAERVPVAGSSDIGLDAVASIDRDRAAAAKASNRVGAGSSTRRPCKMLHKARRICHGGTAGPELPAATTIWMPAAAWASTAACNVSNEQPSEAGQPHELIVISGALVGSPWAGVPSIG